MSALNFNRIKYGILLVSQLVSIPCFLVAFYQFYRQRQLREIHHHVILLLLIVSFLFIIAALPFTEAYLFNSFVYPSNVTYCSIWTWIHYSLNITNLFLMSFASLERNWLVFHPWIVKNKMSRLIFHYIPLTFCVVYPTVFYFMAIFVHQCEPYYDFGQLLCTWPCYFSNWWWSNIDLFFNNYAPLFGIPVFCIIIYVRVFIQRRTMKQKVFKWRRDKKLLIQLWAVSSLYLAMWMPLQVLSMVNLFWDPTFLLQEQTDFIFLFPYFIHFLSPFIVLSTLPQLVTWKRKLRPTAITMTAMR